MQDNFCGWRTIRSHNCLSILIRFSKAISHDPALRPAAVAEDLQALRLEAEAEWRHGSRRSVTDIERAGRGREMDPFAAELKGFGPRWNGSLDDFTNGVPSKPRKSAKS